MPIYGVFFPQVIDPEQSEGDLPFDLGIVPRTIYSADLPKDPNVSIEPDPIIQGIVDVMNAIMNGLYDIEFEEDVFFQLDLAGLGFDYQSPFKISDGKFEVSIIKAPWKIWISDVTQAMFEQSVILSLKQIKGIKDVSIKYI